MNQYGVKTSTLNECRASAINYLKEHNVKPVYIVLSGSHLYGFPSKDSDIDIRCCHIKDTKSLFHLERGTDIYQWKEEIDGIKVEFESSEIQKVITLAMGNNSNILEHIFTKNLLTTESTEMKRLRKLARDSITTQVYYPYHGMGEYNYKKFIESMNPTYEDKLVKKYLYVMRSYLVGEYALLTGKIEPNITSHFNRLVDSDKALIKELIEKKKNAEYQVTSLNHKHCRETIARLKANMELAVLDSPLLSYILHISHDWDDFLYNIRLRNI